jgi:DNA-binding beta-propeller fold protein YncE
VYVVDVNHDAIDVFVAGAPRLELAGTITAGIDAPIDVFVDPAGTLYVANVRDAHPATVTEYAAGTTVPKTTIALGNVHPEYLTVGPDGTLYVMVHNRYARWFVLEFDAGASSPSRTIAIPYGEFFGLRGAGIAVSPQNRLYVSEGYVSSSGGYSIFVYGPKQVTSTRQFSVDPSGYAAGGLEILDDHLFDGDPIDNAVDIATLPVMAVTPPTRMFATEAAGDYLAVDPVSSYLYAVSSATRTLQVYDLRTGRLVTFVTGYRGGVAVDPAGS